MTAQATVMAVVTMVAAAPRPGCSAPLMMAPAVAAHAPEGDGDIHPSIGLNGSERRLIVRHRFPGTVRHEATARRR